MRRAAVFVVLLGCGGEVIAGGDESSSTSTTTTTSSSSSSSSSSSTSTSTSDESSTSWGGGSGYEDDGMLTGCAFTCPSLPPETSGGFGGPYECDPGAQDCVEGEKCMPWANDGGDRWNATRCSPVAPDPGQPGEPCLVEGSGYSGVDDCDVGLMCWRVDSTTNTGTCHQLCSAVEGGAICPDGFVCSQPYGYALRICVTPCDPLAPACQAGEGCYPAGASFGCLPTLSTAVTDGNVCEYRTDCLAGSTCTDDVIHCDGIPCCASFCDTSAPANCDDCTPIAAEPIGLCL